MILSRNRGFRGRNRKRKKIFLLRKNIAQTKRNICSEGYDTFFYILKYKQRSRPGYFKPFFKSQTRPITFFKTIAISVSDHSSLTLTTVNWGGSSTG